MYILYFYFIIFFIYLFIEPPPLPHGPALKPMAREMANNPGGCLPHPPAEARSLLFSSQRRNKSAEQRLQTEWPQAVRANDTQGHSS